MTTLVRIGIVGAGGHGREVAQLIADINADRPRFEIVGFFDDLVTLAGTAVNGIGVVGTIDALHTSRDVDALAIGVGSPRVKLRLTTRLRDANYHYPSLVHPSVRSGAEVVIGDGAMIAAGCLLTCNIRIGAFATVNLGDTLSHDVHVGDFATLAPAVSLAGNVRVGEGAELGVGASAVPSASIGAWSIVGAGAVVTTDIDADVTAVGVPARVISRRNPGWHREDRS